jgi:hypothetical protein
MDKADKNEKVNHTTIELITQSNIQGGQKC